ncbi:MAG: superoxide dismutase family protein [Bacteroidota bacterium]
MKKLNLVGLLLVLLVSYNCKDANKEVKENVDTAEKKKVVESVKLTLESKNDSEVNGEVLFTEKDGKVMMIARLSGLSEGKHSILIHEDANYSGTEGNIGNFEPNAAGYATMQFDSNQWCLECDDSKKNIIGKSVIVLQGAGDSISQPGEAEGDRIRCTGIIQ